MVKVEIISFKEVHVGDVVCEELRDIKRLKKEVVAIHHVRTREKDEPQISLEVMSRVPLELPTKSFIDGHPDGPLILLRRARPDGKTKEEMLAIVTAHAREVVRVCTMSVYQEAVDHLTDPDPVLEELRCALRDYRFSTFRSGGRHADVVSG